jgi:hypothetical protein
LLLRRPEPALVGVFGELEATMSRVSAAAAESKDAWVHTGAVVISRPVGEALAQAVGGHNVGTYQPLFRVAADVPSGQTRVVSAADGEMIVLHNARDLGKLRELARKGSRFSDADEFQQLASKVLKETADPPPPRSIGDALKPVARGTDRGLSDEHVPGFVESRRASPAWGGGSGPPRPPGGATALAGAFDDGPKRLTVAVSREADGSYEVVAVGRFGRRSHSVLTTADAADLTDQYCRRFGGAADGPPPRVVCAGFKSPKHADAFVRALDGSRSRAAARTAFQPAGRLEAKQFREALSRVFPWRQAEVKPVELRHADGGTMATFVIEVPRPAVAKSGLRLKVSSWLDKIIDVTKGRGLRQKIDLAVKEAPADTPLEDLGTLIHERMDEFLEEENIEGFWRSRIDVELLESDRPVRRPMPVEPAPEWRDGIGAGRYQEHARRELETGPTL